MRIEQFERVELSSTIGHSDILTFPPFRCPPESETFANHQARLRFDSGDRSEKRSGDGNKKPFEQ